MPAEVPSIGDGCIAAQRAAKPQCFLVQSRARSVTSRQ